MIKSAEFSTDRKHRFLLTRIWDESKPYAMVIGLNPSNANEDKDDPTISRTIRVLKQLGFGGLKMVNVFSYVTSHPEELGALAIERFVRDMAWLKTTAFGCQEVIFAWGAFPEVNSRKDRIFETFPDGKCFGKSKNGHPWHPSPLNTQMTKAFQAPERKLIKFLDE